MQIIHLRPLAIPTRREKTELKMTREYPRERVSDQDFRVYLPLEFRAYQGSVEAKRDASSELTRKWF